MSATVFFLSTETTPPKFYEAFAFVGFLVAMTWIFVVANEVVGILQAVGLILGISDAILGLTVFAMGNSLGDLVSNITIAKMGFPQMAFSACFGGPLLSKLSFCFFLSEKRLNGGMTSWYSLTCFLLLIGRYAAGTRY